MPSKYKSAAGGGTFEQDPYNPSVYWHEDSDGAPDGWSCRVQARSIEDLAEEVDKAVDFEGLYEEAEY